MVLDNTPRGKIAVVVPHSGQRTETFIRRYAEQLLPGNTVLVFFYRGADEWRVDCPTYFPWQAFGGSRVLAKLWRGAQKTAGIKSIFGDPWMERSLCRFLRQHEVSAVFSQYLSAGKHLQAAAERLGLTHVVRGHGADLSATLTTAKGRRETLILDRASAIVVPTPYQAERLREIGLTKVPIYAQLYGVDLPGMRRLQDDKAPEVRVVCVGRMVAKKAPLLALNSFLQAAEHCPALTLTMVGDGPLADQVRECCARHPRGSRVVLTGALSHEHTLKKISDADIFLQHSITDPQTGDQEGAPVAIMEAMARGLPVVSTRHSGIPYLVEHGKTGLLGEEGDVAAMAENLTTLVRNAGLRRRMGEAARKCAENFTWEQERTQLLKLLLGNEQARS